MEISPAQLNKIIALDEAIMTAVHLSTEICRKMEKSPDQHDKSVRDLLAITDQVIEFADRLEAEFR